MGLLKYIKYVYLIIIVLIGIFYILKQQIEPNTLAASDGIMDLSDWKESKYSIVKIDVDWKPFKSKPVSKLEIIQTNEVAATEEKGHPKIGETIFKVSDEGEGIVAEEIPFIFNRLYSGSSHVGGRDEEVRSRG